MLYCAPNIHLGYEKPSTVQIVLMDPLTKKPHLIWVTPELYMMQANGLFTLILL